MDAAQLPSHPVFAVRDPGLNRAASRDFASRRLPILLAVLGWLAVQTSLEAAAFPLFFEVHPSQGEIPLTCIARGPNYVAEVSGDSLRISLPSAGHGLNPQGGQPAGSPGAGDELALRWQGTQSTLQLHALEIAPGKINSIRGKDPADWILGLTACARVKVPELYPGIDLIYYGNARQLECDLVLAPGADPNAIQLAWEGTAVPTLGLAGELRFPTRGGEVQLCPPIVYQEAHGRRTPIAGRYRFSPPNQIHFEVEAYDHTVPLVIDPVVVYNQLTGGSASEYASGVASDADGNVYVTGYTFSTDFPTVHARQSQKSAPAGDPDAFVFKLDPTGSNLVYATYLGGTIGQVAAGIAVDANRNAWVTGWTGAPDFPLANALQAQHRGGTTDVFIAKLDASGSQLLFATLLGGSGTEFAGGIALDRAGNAYVTGTTSSPDFPTVNAFQPKFRGATDSFLAKVEANGSRWDYVTYLGGDSVELGASIAVTPSGRAVVTGSTGSANFPLLHAWQPAMHGTTDVYVAEFEANGAALRFSTLLGGRLDDFATGIAIGPGEDIWLTGATYSSDFPVLNAFQAVFKSGNCSFGGQPVPCSDAFVTRMKADGQGLVFSTFLGGSAVENPAALLAAVLAHSQAIAVDAQGFAYVTGMTASKDFPTLNAVQQSLAGDADLFVAKFHPTGDLIFSSYGGGSLQDAGTGITADAAGNVFVTGWTQQGTTGGGGGGKRSIGGTENEVKIARLFELPVTPATPASLAGLFSGRFNAQGLFELTLTTTNRASVVLESSSNLLDWTPLPNQ